MIRDWQPCTLTERERRIVRALAEGLYDPQGTKLVEGHPAFAEIIADVEAWLAAPDLMSRTALRALLLVIEVAPLPFGFGACTMSSLPLHDRVRYLATLDARAGSTLTLWKTLLGTAYFAHPIGARELNLNLEEERAKPRRLHQLRRRTPPHHHHATRTLVAGGAL